MRAVGPIRTTCKEEPARKERPHCRRRAVVVLSDSAPLFPSVRPPRATGGARERGVEMHNNFVSELVGTAILILLGNGVVAAVLLAKSKAQNSGWIVITYGWGMAVT